jgi:RNA recognition motif-containing protein
VNIYVGNLSNQTTEDDLRQAFEAFGQVESVNIIKDRFSGESRGFGFVEIASKQEAQKAIEEMNGKDLMGRAVNVNEARPKTDRRDSRGGGRGGNSGLEESRHRITPPFCLAKKRSYRYVFKYFSPVFRLY